VLVACHECGKQVSSEAKACPGCGAPRARDARFKLADLKAFGFLVFGFVVYAGGIVLGAFILSLENPNPVGIILGLGLWLGLSLMPTGVVLLILLRKLPPPVGSRVRDLTSPIARRVLSEADEKDISEKIWLYGLLALAGLAVGVVAGSGL
jgi:hypothetical protein